jgi:hypothetical protein
LLKDIRRFGRYLVAQLIEFPVAGFFEIGFLLL